MCFKILSVPHYYICTADFYLITLVLRILDQFRSRFSVAVRVLMFLDNTGLNLEFLRVFLIQFCLQFSQQEPYVKSLQFQIFLSKHTIFVLQPNAFILLYFCLVFILLILSKLAHNVFAISFYCNFCTKKFTLSICFACIS